MVRATVAVHANGDTAPPRGTTLIGRSDLKGVGIVFTDVAPCLVCGRDVQPHPDGHYVTLDGDQECQTYDGEDGAGFTRHEPGDNPWEWLTSAYIEPGDDGTLRITLDMGDGMERNVSLSPRPHVRGLRIDARAAFLDT